MAKTKSIRVGNVTIGGGKPLVLLAGPCVVEGREITLRIAKKIAALSRKYTIPVVFKSSYRKANRTSGKSFTGVGDQEALRILEEVKRELGLPIVTDIHTAEEAVMAAEVADILQIPAFLCRQTDLLQAAGRTGRVVNIKKGQFLAPQDMAQQAEKVAMTGNKKIMLTERGTTFGYNNLVVDMRALPIMRSSGYPVVLDATHAVQLPGGEGTRTGGQPEYIFPLARAGAAIGIDALFVETHPDPPRALSDATSQLKLDLLATLIQQILPLDAVAKKIRGH